MNFFDKRYSIALMTAAVLGTSLPVYAVPPVVVDLATDTNAVKIVGDDINDSLGNVATACDFNGDDIEDLIVGAPRADGPTNSRPGAGEVYVVFGQRKGWHGPLQMTDIRNIWIYGKDVNDLTGEGVGCGDLNGDGRNDLVVAASFADGPSESRIQAGDVHVLFGAPTFPTIIDLSATPGSIVYGDVPSGRLGESTGVAVGDVNADGTPDLLLSAFKSYGKTSANDRAGRAYVVFGSASWPAITDLRSESDVTIFGERVGAALGTTTDALDVDMDGTKDLVFGSGGSGGPNNIRSGCGEVHVFRGRASWPSEINLATSSSDMRVFAPDSGDGLAGQQKVSSGDVDGDGRVELWIGAGLGDGRTNTVLEAGEVLAYEPTAGLPPIVDLRTASDARIYGEAPADGVGAALRIGDVNGDGRDDVVFFLAGDGSDNLRTDAGEISVFYGPLVYPADRDASDNDVVVYGPLPSSDLALRAVVDLNNDGLKEILGIMHFSSDIFPPSLWLISPYDTDGDGVSQLPDNCPLVANVNQLDGNLDGRGDACQTDWDGDGLNDAVDCGPNKVAAGKPLDVVGLGFASRSDTVLVWQPEVHAELYDITRGTLPRTAVTDYGVCQNAGDSDRSDTQFVDGDVPPFGTSYFYLVRAVDSDCGGTGSWGQDSSGATRVSSNPGTCP